MLSFKLTDIEAVPYLYEERSCGMDPQDIGAAMKQVFENVMRFLKSHNIEPPGEALSVYYTYDPNKMTFRAGYFVSEDDAAKAEGEIQAGSTPAGKVLTFAHLGPYAGLRNRYGEMMTYLEENGLKIGAPTWEVYLNSPAIVPEKELRTEVFVSLA